MRPIQKTQAAMRCACQPLTILHVASFKRYFQRSENSHGIGSAIKKVKEYWPKAQLHKHPPTTKGELGKSSQQQCNPSGDSALTTGYTNTCVFRVCEYQISCQSKNLEESLPLSHNSCLNPFLRQGGLSAIKSRYRHRHCPAEPLTQVDAISYLQFNETI